MIIQIINLSDHDVFKLYSNGYKIFRDVYDFGLFGLEIRNVPFELAEGLQNIILNEKEICYKNFNGEGELNLFFTGYLQNLKSLTKRIILSGMEDLGNSITGALKNYENYNSLQYKIGNKVLDFRRSYVMGILNVTPDSFSDSGRFFNKGTAVEHGIKMLNKGADILDIGGESSRPGSDFISAEEELDRVIPVIESIHNRYPEAVISIDTSKSKVADEALLKGASIVNDISGFTFDEEMIHVIKKHNASASAMHIKGKPKNMQKDPEYGNLISEIYDFLFTQVKKAYNAGIKNIFIDPGIGFGKTVQHNLELIRRLDDFKSIGCPILIGVSRKSFLGKLLNIEVESRDTATAIVEAAALIKGAKVIRTHNVDNGVQVCKLLNELV